MSDGMPLTNPGTREAPVSGPTIAVFVPTPCIDRYVIVSSLPAAGWKVIGQDLGELHGGVAGNFAVAAARLGADVHAIGWAGTDAASVGAVHSLRVEGVDVSLVHGREAHPVFRTTVLVDGHGERSVVLFPPNDGFEDLAPAWPGALRLLAPALCYVGPWNRVAATLAEAARAAGAIVAATLESDSGRGTAFDWASLWPVDLLFMSEETAGLFGWAADRRAALPEDRDRWPRVVVITLGAAGAQYVMTEDGSSVHAAGREVVAIDTTGAGDTFAAAFCIYWAEGLRGARLLARANAAGAFATTALGPRAGMPSRAQVEEDAASMRP
jgi:sugar/nucleoside kinase (ribokinase family)